MNTLTTLGVFLMAVYPCYGNDCCGNSKSGNWEYQYEVIFPGTRSEYISGKLLYMGEELPEKLGHVVTPVGEFIFYDTKSWRKGPASFKWLAAFKRQDGKLVLAMRETEIKELFSGVNKSFRFTGIKNEPSLVSNKASISGKFEERPKDVGADWFFAVGQSLWVNPSKVDAVSHTPTESVEKP